MTTVSRREFLRTTAVSGAAMAAGCAAAGGQKAQRPNVLLIIDDQHNKRAMGWTGQSQAITPALDRLAAESACFTNAYCNSPVCAPTRHTIYSGLYPSEHGVYNNDNPMHEHIPTMMAYLNEAGYTTANIGKMHNAPYHHRRDFQYVLNHEFFINSGGISHYAAFKEYELARRGLEHGPEWSKPAPGLHSWLEDPDCIAFTNWMPEDLTPERWTTDQSLRFIKDQLENRPGKPFFLHASYFPPHHPYGPIKKYRDMYNAEDMELPPNFNRARADAFCGGRGRPAHLSDDEYRRFMACYYAFTTQLDAELGRLFDGLDELGVADNTIVMFMSDHGDMMGEQGYLYKGVMNEGSAGIPFIVRWPGIRKHQEIAAPVSHADIMPTVLRAAGVEPDPALPGEDLAPLIYGETTLPDKVVYSEYLPWLPYLRLMVRKGDYKLSANRLRRAEDDLMYELFNVAEDPWELRNLADDPGHRTVFDELKAEMDARWARQSQFMPDTLPGPMPRSEYRIPWPADPWKPVEIVDPLT